jgi:restriction system protein
MMVSGLAGGIPFFLSIMKPCLPFLLLFVGLKYGLPYFLKARQRRQLSGIGIADVDALDGKRFEVYLEVRFHERGYRVQRTPYQGDWGADLILEKDGQRTAVQAKRYKKNVGVRMVDG